MATGHYPLDPTTDVGLVRTMTGDVDPSNIQGVSPNQTADYYWNTDAEITALVTVNGGSAPRAAIYILRMVSLTPAMILKKWASADLSVDGARITEALTAAITAIRKDLDDATLLANSDFFEVVNTGPAVAQPSLYERYYPVTTGLTDPTLPAGLM